MASSALLVCCGSPVIVVVFHSDVSCFVVLVIHALVLLLLPQCCFSTVRVSLVWLEPVKEWNVLCRQVTEVEGSLSVTELSHRGCRLRGRGCRSTGFQFSNISSAYGCGRCHWFLIIQSRPSRSFGYIQANQSHRISVVQVSPISSEFLAGADRVVVRDH